MSARGTRPSPGRQDVRVPSWTRVAAVLALLLAGCGGEGPSAGRAAEAGRAHVVRVVDGDTIVVRLAGAGEAEEKVRLIGIDTPETADPRATVECFGQDASRRTAALLPPGTAVRLVRDVEARDRYSRLLAYVYRASDGLFVNLALVAEGYAAVATYPPNVAHVEEFAAAARRAQEGGRGLWGRCR